MVNHVKGETAAVTRLIILSQISRSEERRWRWRVEGGGGL